MSWTCNPRRITTLPGRHAHGHAVRVALWRVLAGPRRGPGNSFLNPPRNGFRNMARPKKVGLDYFPLDCLPDEKLRGLDTIHENDGFAWFIKFLQSAYQTENGEVDCSGLFGELMAKNSRITLEKQDRIIKTCLDLKLLYRTPENLLTSHGIKTRMGAVSKERAAAVERKYQRELEKEKESKSKKSKEKDCPHSSANNDSYSANNRKAGDADGPITPEANAQLEESPAHEKDNPGAGGLERQSAPIISQVLEYFNQKISTHYKTDTGGFIRARIEEGYSLEDFKRVIDVKHDEWCHDPKFHKFLRPRTLFDPIKFVDYLNQHYNPKPLEKKAVR